MSSIVVNDVFDELREENDRLLNELRFANKCLKTFIRFKTFIDKISYLFEYNLETNDRQKYEEIVKSVNEVCDGFETRTHIQSESVLLFNPFVCDLCNKRFKNQNILNSHLRNVHKGKVINDVEENNCLKRSDSSNIETKAEENDEMKYSLKKDVHEEMVTNDIEANDWSKTFDSSSIEINTKTEPNVKTEDMTDSALTDDNPTTDPNPNKNRITALKRQKNRRERQEVYACHQPNCDRVFHYPWHLANHQRSHIPRQIKVCPICQKKFLCDSLLDIHISSHDTIGRLQCTVIGCEKRFKHKSALKYHMERVHGDKGFPCDWPGCDFKASHLIRLVEHKSYVHSDERNFPCEWPGCDMKCKTKTQLRTHTQVHNGDKRFQCNWPGCDYKTVSKWNLKGHVLSHSDELNFECVWPECGKKFKTERYMKNHMKNVHKVSNN